MTICGTRSTTRTRKRIFLRAQQLPHRSRVGETSRRLVSLPLAVTRFGIRHGRIGTADDLFSIHSLLRPFSPHRRLWRHAVLAIISISSHLNLAGVGRESSECWSGASASIVGPAGISHIPRVNNCLFLLLSVQMDTRSDTIAFGLALFLITTTPCCVWVPDSLRIDPKYLADPMKV